MGQKIIITILLILIIFGIFIAAPAYLPKIPESLAILVVEQSGAETQEQVADIEILYRLLCSFFIATVITTLGFIFKRLLTKK